ncbi:MAG: hypothetical protein A2049_12920 [Elusimicrobia bacterium GWA2_62_23]|nr:MAG: hypothetical protein A2049_12920 [Elusimicrobia bacterium GWA2_62_23]
MKRFREFFRDNPMLALALLAFFAVYSASLNNGFHRDDHPHIAGNAAIRDLSNFPKLFSRDYFVLSGSVAYRPMVTAFRFAQYRVFGTDARLWRLFNLLVHALNAVLLCLVVIRVSGSRPAAAAAAALFLLHPAHTEALNYISNGQPDMLCLLFLCAASLAYLSGRLAWTAAWFLLALFSKEMALAFPVLLLIYEYSRGGLRRAWRLPALLAAAALLFAVWRLAWFRAGPVFLDNAQADAAFGFSAQGSFTALLQFPALAGYYLKLLVWPAALSVEIDRLLPETGFFSLFNALLAWLALLALAAWGIMSRLVRPWALFAFAFFAALLPVSGLVPLTSRVQEHFVYVPSALFCALAGILFARGSAAGGKARAAALAAVMVALGASAVRVYARNADWRSPAALAEADLKAFPGSLVAMVNLAVQKKASGDRAGALALCQAALEGGFAGGEVHFLLADLYLVDGLREKAAAAARAGLEKEPGSPDSWVNAARVLARAGLLDEAETAAREATARFGYFPPAFSTLGEILRLRGRPGEAAGMFSEAARLGGRTRAR